MQPSLDHRQFALSNQSRLLTLSIPQFADYDIFSPEYLSLIVPPDAVASRQRVTAAKTLRIDARRGVAELSGSLLEDPTEDAVRSAATLSLYVRLRGDTWMPAVGTDSSVTVLLLMGLRSSISAPSGWGEVVQSGLSYEHVTRMNESTVLIEVPQFAQYSVTEPELITLTLPELAVRSNLAIVASPPILLRATPGQAQLSGTLTTDPTEAALATAGGHTLHLTLVHEEWSPEAFAAMQWAYDGAAAAESRAVVEAIVQGLLSEQNEPSGWNAVVRPLLALTNVSAGSDGRTMVLHLPLAPLYSISEPETLFVQLPASALSSDVSLFASPALVIGADAGVGFLGGHLHANPREEVLRAATGTNLSLVLGGDSWQPTVGQPHLSAEARQLNADLISGLISAQSEASGWNRVVLPRLLGALGGIVRLDDHAVLLELPHLADYEITAPETISALIPPAAVRSGRRAAMSSTLVVRPTTGRARLAGSFLHNPSEEAIRAAGTLELTISLTGDRWSPEIGRQASTADHAVARALLAGISPSLSVPSAWGSVVQQALTAANVRRTSDSSIAITVPPFLGYDIAEPETLTITLPAEVLLSRQPIAAVPQVRVLAANGSLELRGTLLITPTEVAIQGASPAPSLRLDLLGDSWAAGIGEFSMLNGSTPIPANAPASRALLAGVRSQQGGATGWNRVVQAALGPLDISRLTNSSLLISLPAARSGYEISEPETMTVAVPEAALLSGRQVFAAPQFIILPTPGQGRLSNSLVLNNSETDVQGGGVQLTVTLIGDSWAPTIGQRGSGTAASLTAQVLRSFISAQDEDSGWNAVVLQALVHSDLSYVDGSSITLSLPPFPAYDLLKAETVSVNIPPAAVASRQEIFAGIGASRTALQVSANTGTIQLEGSLFDYANETTIKGAGSYKIIITLTGDSWSTGVGQQDESGAGASAQLLQGLTSLQSESTGWNSIVRPGIPQRNVERTSDFVVTITVDQFASYDITAPETIQVVVPPIAVSSAQVVRAPSFVLVPIKGSASLSGGFIRSPGESTLCCGGGLQMTITLTDDSFADGVGVEPAASAALAQGLQSLQMEPHGWNLVVQPALIATNTSIVRVSEREVRLQLPPQPAYSIAEPETIVFTLPAATISSKQRLVAAPAKGIIVRPAPSAVTLGGSLHPTAEEASLRQLWGTTLTISLLDDAFLPGVALPGAASADLLKGIQSAQNESSHGWNAIVRPALSFTDVFWNATNASVSAAGAQTDRRPPHPTHPPHPPTLAIPTTHPIPQPDVGCAPLARPSCPPKLADHSSPPVWCRCSSYGCRNSTSMRSTRPRRWS